MALTWDSAQFAASYSVRDRNPSSPTFGQRFGYGRKFAEIVMSPGTSGLTMYEHRRDKLVELFPIQQADRILVGGCGYGFLIEVFRDAGYPNVWGIDNSAYIDGNRSIHARQDIANEWVVSDIRSGAQAKNALRQLTGDDIFQWVVTEQLLEGFTDAELPNVFAAADAVTAPGGSVVHLIVPDQGPDVPQNAEMNWKSLAAWKALYPAHSFIDIVTWTVL